MPRQRGGAAPRRPTIAPSVSKQQTRPSSTAAVPARVQQAPPPVAAQAHPPATASQGPGLFGQMASTAAGVAVGSTVGHMVGAGITGLFGGGSSQPAAAEAAPAQPQVQAASNSYGDRSNVSCEADAKSFTKCMDDYKGDMTVCGWYLEQLKACQNMAKNY
ncbi:hypothetical protein L211DRAFT_842569 [Terfezia boudieri ATCC MYA-4762]|uniref:CHCH domain-containing protein n=1 Tax=Terfezia boudieri ATCC MYA-4762 TaxID=1051890 RepID=A0A3N4LNE5_9PEZI|nr:hypothetical protein L211DRAFT_842569 [Terfezia boudieri ATCC MYA-4762]